jgi:hypothetical protein
MDSNSMLVIILFVILIVLISLNHIENFQDNSENPDEDSSKWLNSMNNSMSGSNDSKSNYPRESNNDNNIKKTEIEMVARSLARQYCPVDQDFDINEWVKKTECRKGQEPCPEIDLKDYILKSACPPQHECPPCICPKVEVSNTDCSNSASCPTQPPHECKITAVKTIEKKKDIIKIIQDMYNNSKENPDNMDKLVHIKELVDGLNIPESSDALMKENESLKKKIEYLEKEYLNEKSKQKKNNDNQPRRDYDNRPRRDYDNRPRRDYDNNRPRRDYDDNQPRRDYPNQGLPQQQNSRNVKSSSTTGQTVAEIEQSLVDKAKGIFASESVTTLSPTSYDTETNSFDIEGYNKGLNGTELPSNLIEKCNRK